MKKKITKLRLIILAIFVIFITYEAFMHQVKGGGPDGSPSIHALCPYGGLESLYNLFTTGKFIDKVYAGTFSLFIISVITAVFLRRSFCGWICPLGGIQDFFGRLGRKIMKVKFNMPKKVDGLLRYLKYVILAITIIFAWTTASMWMSPYDPWAAYGHLGEGIVSVWSEFAIGFIILIISLLGSFFYDRFFCKYLCPMGGFLAIVSKISPFKIKRDDDVCIDCNLCTKVCTMNIDVAKIEHVSTSECINCQECLDVCPKDGALVNDYKFLKGKKIKPLVIGLTVLVIYFGGIGISKLFNKYNMLPQNITSGVIINDVEELKGYMTLTDISVATGFTLDELYTRMEIPNDISADIPLKEMKNYVDGFDFHTAKEKLK